MPLCQQDTPGKTGNLQTKQCSIFTTYFGRFSRCLSAHTNVELRFSLKTYHQACEHNLYRFIMLTSCSHTWCLYGRTKTTVHIRTHWYTKLQIYWNVFWKYNYKEYNIKEEFLKSMPCRISGSSLQKYSSVSCTGLYCRISPWYT